MKLSFKDCIITGVNLKKNGNTVYKFEVKEDDQTLLNRTIAEAAWKLGEGVDIEMTSGEATTENFPAISDLKQDNPQF
jgi:hypothetical protein